MPVRLVVVAFLGALVVILQGCANEARQIQILTDQPQPAHLVPGERFGLVLRASPGAGMEWQLAEPLNEQVVVFCWKTYRQTYTFAPDYVPGFEGVETWIFQAVAPGETTLRMKYVPKNNPNATPAILSDFVILVSPRR